MKNCATAVFLLCFLALGLFGRIGVADAAQGSKAVSGIIIATPSEPDTLDLTTTKYSVTSSAIGNNIYERLVDLTPEGNFVPGIASWKISPDGKVVEFALKKGIKFQSGDPLTTKDVEFSHMRAMKTNPTHQRAMRNLDRFEIVDDYVCRFVFKKPDVLFIPTRSLAIASKSYYDRVGEEQFVAKPMGTGPYKFVSWTPGQSIEIAANENYWGPKPQVKKAQFRFIKEDATRVAMLTHWSKTSSQPGSRPPAFRPILPPRFSFIRGTRMRPGTTGASVWPSLRLLTVKPL
jgi:peptide/nickel transport system substrate-binding protein